MKEILVLTGGTRKKGNTMALARAFIHAAEAKGHKITRFDTAFLHISGCRDCGNCFAKGKACGFNDDFNEIAPAIDRADAVAFVMPLFWYSAPAQIKAVIDKLYAFPSGRKKGRTIDGREIDIQGKGALLLAACHEEDLSAFDGLRIAYEKSLSYLNWTSLGEVYVTGVRDLGDIEKTDGEVRAAALAERL